MKDTTKAAILGACLATAAATLLPPLIHQEAKAQEAEVKPVQIVEPIERYKVVSLIKLENDGPGRMDQELNRLAAEGWRVRTGVGGAAILAR